MKTERKFFRWGRIALAALFFAVMAAAFSGLAAWAAKVPHLEFAPAMLRCGAAFSLGALATVAIILLLTWLFGRFYCAFFCPLGIWQDLVGWASRRKGRTEANHTRIRYVIVGFAVGALAAWWTMPFLLLDPYSNYGRIVAGGFVLGGIIPFALITLLAAWKKRLFCTTVCPVGTILGLVSRFGLFKLRLTDSCVKCGQCVKSCPAGCIDPAGGTLDNERCVRCLNCLAVCRAGGVEYTARRHRAEPPTDRSRRELIINGAGLFTGMVLGAGIGKWAAFSVQLTDLERFVGSKSALILPPGAKDAARFTLRCTACQLCIANCPAKIIVPAPGGDGPVRLDLSRGACRYDCNKCSNICPTGALTPLTLAAKRRTRIAETKSDPKLCIAFQTGEKCGRCAAACPTGAIKLRKNGTPRPVNNALCIGCGACQAACPATPKAVTVHGVPTQKRLDG